MAEQRVVVAAEIPGLPLQAGVAPHQKTPGPAMTARIDARDRARRQIPGSAA